MKRRVMTGSIAAMALGGLSFVAAPAVSGAQQADLDCADFPTQQAAQEELNSNPSDPHDLDRDGDGVACEANQPGDGTPTPSSPAAPIRGRATFTG
jgi:hypothetical protein